MVFRSCLVLLAPPGLRTTLTSAGKQATWTWSHMTSSRSSCVKACLSAHSSNRQTNTRQDLECVVLTPRFGPDLVPPLTVWTEACLSTLIKCCRAGSSCTSVFCAEITGCCWDTAAHVQSPRGHRDPQPLRVSLLRLVVLCLGCLIFSTSAF